MYGEVFVYFYFHYTYLNQITGDQLEAIHLSFSLRHLSDKHHHGPFVFHLQKSGNERKSDWLFLFSTTITHGTHPIFEVMTKFVFIKMTEF